MITVKRYDNLPWPWSVLGNRGVDFTKLPEEVQKGLALAALTDAANFPEPLQCPGCLGAHQSIVLLISHCQSFHKAKLEPVFLCNSREFTAAELTDTALCNIVTDIEIHFPGSHEKLRTKGWEDLPALLLALPSLYSEKDRRGIAHAPNAQPYKKIREWERLEALKA